MALFKKTHHLGFLMLTNVLMLTFCRWQWFKISTAWDNIFFVGDWKRVTYVVMCISGDSLEPSSRPFGTRGPNLNSDCRRLNLTQQKQPIHRTKLKFRNCADLHALESRFAICDASCRRRSSLYLAIRRSDDDIPPTDASIELLLVTEIFYLVNVGFSALVGPVNKHLVQWVLVRLYFDLIKMAP